MLYSYLEALIKLDFLISKEERGKKEGKEEGEEEDKEEKAV